MLCDRVDRHRRRGLLVCSAKRDTDGIDANAGRRGVA
jgi:hypothetical protein